MTRAASVKNAPTWKISGNTTTKKGVAENVRKKIVNKAREICDLHQKYKKLLTMVGLVYMTIAKDLELVELSTVLKSILLCVFFS